MKKSDLRNGMIVKTRAGNYYLVVRDFDNGNHQSSVLLRDGGFLELCDYSEDMKTLRGHEKFDIVEVFKTLAVGRVITALGKEASANIISIWKREEKIDCRIGGKCIFE